MGDRRRAADHLGLDRLRPRTAAIACGVAAATFEVGAIFIVNSQQ
jgi:hypothetical protein